MFSTSKMFLFSLFGFTEKQGGTLWSKAIPSDGGGGGLLARATGGVRREWVDFWVL
jgi:hypothetical protein